MVDCFFSRLDCVYGVQSNVCSCVVFFFFSLFFTWVTFIPRLSVPSLINAPIISWFYEAFPSEICDGLWLISWSSVLWFAKPPLLRIWTSRPTPHLSGMCSGCIVNNVCIAYQFEPKWDAEDISEEDHAEPVQALLLMVCFCCCCYWFILLDTLLFIRCFILIKALIQHGNCMHVHV